MRHTDGIATKIDRQAGWTFDRHGMIAWSMLVASGLSIVYANMAAFTDELKRMFDPGMWVVLIGMWCIAKALHEMGHAWGALVQGVPVRRIMLHGGGGFCERARSATAREDELIVIHRESDPDVLPGEEAL